MKIEDWPIGKVRPYEQNPRTIPPKAVEAVAASIREFGWKQPLVVDADGVLIVGHTRFLAAQSLGFSHVPVHVARDLSAEQVRAYRLADNKTNEQAKWDDGLLAGEIEALVSLGHEMGAYGFDAKDLAGEASLRPDPSRLSRPVPETDLQHGDLLILGGEHRLFVGSCRDPAQVEAALDGIEPHLTVTDPPYGVDYEPGWRSRMDSKLSTRSTRGVDDSREAFRGYVEAALLPSVDVAYVWHATRNTDVLLATIEAAGFENRAILAWVKERQAIGRGHISWQHEPCVYGVRRGSPTHWAGGKRASSVLAPGKGSAYWPEPGEEDLLMDGAVIFAASTDEKNLPHAAQKPVETMARPIRWSSQPGDHVWEPFAGSGTTYIAAHRYGRRCVGMEIDPVYVEITRQRWEEITGLGVEVVRGAG